MTTVFLFLLPSFFVGGPAILGPRRVWRLVLSLFRKDRGLVERVLGRRGLAFGRGSMSETITSWAALSHVSDERSPEAIAH